MYKEIIKDSFVRFVKNHPVKTSNVSLRLSNQNEANSNWHMTDAVYAFSYLVRHHDSNLIVWLSDLYV